MNQSEQKNSFFGKYRKCRSLGLPGKGIGSGTSCRSWPCAPTAHLPMPSNASPSLSPYPQTPTPADRPLQACSPAPLWLTYREMLYEAFMTLPGWCMSLARHKCSFWIVFKACVQTSKTVIFPSNIMKTPATYNYVLVCNKTLQEEFI